MSLYKYKENSPACELLGEDKGVAARTLCSKISCCVEFTSGWKFKLS